MKEIDCYRQAMARHGINIEAAREAMRAQFPDATDEQIEKAALNFLRELGVNIDKFLAPAKGAKPASRPGATPVKPAPLTGVSGIEVSPSAKWRCSKELSSLRL